MGYSIEILNNIRANASEEYKRVIPEATQTNIAAIGQSFQTYDLVYNEFASALIHKIGKTLLEQKLFSNKLAKFKSGLVSPHDVEEIFTEMVNAEGAFDPDGKNPLGRRKVDNTKVMYHRQNRQDYWCISLGDLDFVRCFRSEATLDEYILGKINAVYSGAEYAEWCAMKNVLATYKNMTGTAHGYFDYQVPVITDATAESSCKKFVKTLRKAVQDLSFASTKYNAAGVRTWTNPSDMVLFIHKDVIAEIDVEVLAKAFNMGKTDINVQIEVMDDFGTLTDTYGILADKKFLKVWDTLSKMEQQRNAQGLFTNFFYHVHQILSASKFKNAVRFTTAEVTE